MKYSDLVIAVMNTIIQCGGGCSLAHVEIQANLTPDGELIKKGEEAAFIKVSFETKAEDAPYT